MGGRVWAWWTGGLVDWWILVVVLVVLVVLALLVCSSGGPGSPGSSVWTLMVDSWVDCGFAGSLILVYLAEMMITLETPRGCQGCQGY